MGTVTGYDILKFVDHGERCYVSTDYIQGRPLIQWLKYHPDMSKAQLWQWLTDIVHALGQFYRCNNAASYQYVNPYSIIVSENKKLYFLDVGSRSQEYLLRKMQQRAVREAFLSPANLYYQKADVEEDIYGLGRTLQYILAAVIPEPPLSKSEITKLQKVISRCLNRRSKKQYHTIQEISEQFPKIKKIKDSEQKTKRRKAKIVLILITVALLAAALTGNGVFLQKDATAQTKDAKADKNLKKQKVLQSGSVEDREETKLLFDMGMLYFLKLKDYERSREIFSRIEKTSEMAGYYVKLSGYLLRGEDQIIGREVEKVLGKIEDLSAAEVKEEGEKIYTGYDISLLRGYALLDSEESCKKRIEIGERCVEKGFWGEADNDLKEEGEVRAGLAAAYEEAQEYEKAEEQYKVLMSINTDEKEREELYQKRALLYTQMERSDEALKVLKEAVEEFKKSVKLRILYIKIQCQDTSLDRGICAQTIRDNLKELPEIAQEEEFEKLKQQYDIKIEGEEVWVGR